MPKALTDSVVKTLKPERGATDWREISDGGCRGLRLRLSPTGEKVWALKVTVNGRRVRHTLGAYPALSLSEAREKVREYAAEARAGAAPEQIDARKKAEVMTLADAHEEYVKAVKASLRSSTVALKEGLFATHVKPIAGNRLIRLIRRADIVEVVGAVAGKGFPTQANRVYSEVMALLRWAESKGYVDGVPSIRKKDLRHHGAAQEQPRARTLTDAELRTLWALAGNIGSLTGDFLRLLMLTGQRRDEVRLMSWEEIDMAEAVWTIPASRYKTGVDHVVPLSGDALAILTGRHAKGATGFVLAGRGEGKPFAGQASAMRRIREKMKGKTFSLHDIRRTVRTGLSRLGVDEVTAEKVIGHMPQGIVKVYDVHDRMAERRAALELWSKHLAQLVAAGEAPNVVQLRREA